MKTLRKHIILLSFALAFLGSCSKDYFELERPPQTPWTSLTEFDRAPVGLYYTLFWGDNWSIAWVNASLPKVSAGDDVEWVANAEWGFWRKTKEFNKYTDRAWFQIYRAIGGANNALDFVAKNGGNPFPDISDADKNNNLDRIVGECHFIRGYSYYLLQTTFGHAYVPGGNNSTPDIPLFVHYPTNVNEAKSPKIGTTEEIYQQIVADLEKAKELLPAKYDASMNASYQVRATRYAASAMLMRAYMQMGNYTKALAECNYLIDQSGGEFDLSEAPIAAFNKSDKSRGKEVIFYVPYYDTQGTTPLHMTVLCANAGPWGQCNWNETRMGKSTVTRLGWMNNPDTDTTINVAAYRDKRFQQLFSVRYPASLAKPGQAKDPRNEVKDKTTIWPNKNFRGPGQFNTNLPLIRLAEVYLTRSILRFKANDKAGAAADLNVVRKRAWDTNVGGSYEDITSATITEQLIHDERLIEFFGEPDRIDYLRALKMDIPKGERGAGVDPYTSEDFVWAIPNRELLYNESLKGSN
jgi:tetratricopeptide (TPR) repeat protein